MKDFALLLKAQRDRDRPDDVDRDKEDHKGRKEARQCEVLEVREDAIPKIFHSQCWLKAVCRGTLSSAKVINSATTIKWRRPRISKKSIRTPATDA
ncbi:Uncharacterised protein [Chlamydia trachomatis]|nr:Uncharacterised protein [Chlamydia trachomatis]